MYNAISGHSPLGQCSRPDLVTSAASTTTTTATTSTTAGASLYPVTYAPMIVQSLPTEGALAMSLFGALPADPLPYAYAPAVSQHRQYLAHATSSAFSASANPDEDWTKISDLAERRRIQNRIAQRNYRKKLKRRLEDLERRAGTTDGPAGPSPPAAAERCRPVSGASKPKKQPAPKKQPPGPLAATAGMGPSSPPHAKQPSLSPMPHIRFTPPPMHYDDELLFPPPYDERERSNTPPSLFSYAAYPQQPPPPPQQQNEDMLLGRYGSAQPYHRQPIAAADTYAGYLAAASPVLVPVALPPMTPFSNTIKRDPYTGTDDFVPYAAAQYGFVPGVDVSAASDPYDFRASSTSHTPPPLPHFTHSAGCSNSGYEYPATPLSLPPGSPNTLSQH